MVLSMLLSYCMGIRYGPCIITVHTNKVVIHYKMATRTKSLSGASNIDARPKKSRQGNGQHTKYSATSRNAARKRYRGQGK